MDFFCIFSGTGNNDEENQKQIIQRKTENLQSRSNIICLDKKIKYVPCSCNVKFAVNSSLFLQICEKSTCLWRWNHLIFKICFNFIGCYYSSPCLHIFLEKMGNNLWMWEGEMLFITFHLDSYRYFIATAIKNGVQITKQVSGTCCILHLKYFYTGVGMGRTCWVYCWGVPQIRIMEV